ncbi:endonuclease NucS domain-containing protein [Variovorax sp. CCNWLW186]|uniref:endonuclease NucS domain-containing protein n=1 Tax=Variovorax sp. CCNWLW186 TaxID=3127473 RepID=UPI003076FEEE
MSVRRTENEIRDHLIANLNLIEPGLTLIGREVVLRNDKGAKGFLDIFCRTASGKFLIIEVKRSDAAAREAIQELVKYAVLLRQNLLVKDTEVRLMVASTAWHELLVPFSEFVRETPYDCTGIQLVLGNDGLVTSAIPVELAAADRPRRLSRRHFIWGYKNEAKARTAVSVIAAHMKEAGLRDFLLLLLAINSGDDPAMRFVYFVQQELSLERYMDLIRARSSDESFVEFKGWLSDISELEDKVSEAADKVWEETTDSASVFEASGAIHAQIAYPEKAEVWFSSETLVSMEVFRFGRFDDPNITDSLIVEEIRGHDGTSYHHIDIRAQTGSKTEMAALLSAADSLFHLNPIWRTAIHDLCSYAIKTGTDAVRMRAFSNDDILRTVACIAIGCPDYAPTFAFEIHRGGQIELILGVIEWDGRKADFAHIIAEYFAGDPFQYFMERHFGGHRALNADLMAEMGLSYAVGRLEDQSLIPVRVSSARIEDVRGPRRRALAELTDENLDFSRALVGLFHRHEQAFAHLFEQAAFVACEARLDALKNVGNDADPTYWSGSFDQCDVCKRDMGSARFMVDSAVVRNGPWGCMCAVCFDKAGGEIGWGSGQLYEKNESGWRLVGGGASSEASEIAQDER